MITNKKLNRSLKKNPGPLKKNGQIADVQQDWVWKNRISTKTILEIKKSATNRDKHKFLKKHKRIQYIT